MRRRDAIACKFSIMRTFLILAMVLASRPFAVGAANLLTFYFIDVEGGQSTLIVTPAGDSLLVDSGYAANGRDSSRILAAVRDAGVHKIDHLLLTHFHTDHIGGVAELIGKIPTGTFYDHGVLGQPPGQSALVAASLAAYEKYIALRGIAKHVEPRVGSAFPLKGVTATWVSSAGMTIRTALSGAGEANASCPVAAPPPDEQSYQENSRSTGFYLRFGKFRFVDLGDLVGLPLFSLICPANRLGQVDLYLLPHHGNVDAGYPATFAAFHPRIAVINNGPAKGGAADVFEQLRQVGGVEDVWQLHRAVDPKTRNFADDHIANIDESTAHWLKVTAAADGSFTVTNGRTGQSRQYAAR